MKPVLKAGLVVFVVVFCIFVVGSASYPDYTEYKNDREAAAQIKIESGLFVNRLDDAEREQNRSEYVQENEVVNTPYPENDEEYLELYPNDDTVTASEEAGENSGDGSGGGTAVTDIPEPDTGLETDNKLVVSETPEPAVPQTPTPTVTVGPEPTKEPTREPTPSPTESGSDDGMHTDPPPDLGGDGEAGSPSVSFENLKGNMTVDQTVWRFAIIAEDFWGIPIEAENVTVRNNSGNEVVLLGETDGRMEYETVFVEGKNYLTIIVHDTRGNSFMARYAIYCCPG